MNLYVADAKWSRSRKDKDSQGHWWRVEFPETALWPSGAEEWIEEKKKKEKTPVSSSTALHVKFPIGFFTEYA